MKLLFRADGNPQIGSGHIMRCLSVAEALRERGACCHFALADPAPLELIRRAGFEASILHTSFERMDEEIEAFCRLIERENTGMAVIDSYYITEKYLRSINSKVKTAYVDDLLSMAYPVECVLNYNLYAAKKDYQVLYKKAGQPIPKLLLGPQYAPLRKEFRNREPKIQRAEMSEILFLTGGADLEHVAIRQLEYLRRGTKYRWHFVIGALNQDLKEIQRLSADMPFVEIHRNVTEMYALMMRCDVAISASGSTMYELCASGIPTISYVLADNQLRNAQTFCNCGASLYAGDVRGDSNFPKTFEELLLRLAGDYGERCALAKAGRVLVDGNGAVRIADYLMQLMML